MSTLHFRNVAGNYIGGFGDGAEVPDGAIPCPAPTNAKDVWSGTQWETYVPSPAEVEAVVQVELERKFGAGASDFDKAGALLDADIWKYLHPELTKAQARAAVRARYETHLRAIKGI